MSVRILEISKDVPVRNRIGLFTLRAYLIAEGPHIDTHLAIFKGPLTNPVPVRVNSACLTGEVFGDRRCDCAWQMWEALRRFEDRGQGVMTYHPSHEGRGIGLFQKIRSYELMDERGLTTREAFQELGETPDLRSYASATAILEDLGVREAQFLSNNPEKIRALSDSGIKVVGSERVVMDFDKSLVGYLQSKAAQFGHLIDLPTFMLGVPVTEDVALWPQATGAHDDIDSSRRPATTATATGA
jgi:3,4-dihydroxy 2-butanone 4-phosphate synthase/GTP cyclohydrolase II